MNIREHFHSLHGVHGLAFWFNLFGLSLAFVVFYVLMSEVNWTIGFDRFHKDADRVCQVSRYYKNSGRVLGREWEVFSGQDLRDVFANLRDVEAAVACFHYQVGGECELLPSDTVYDMEAVKTEFLLTTEGMPEVFTFDFVEGDASCYSDPTYAFLPLSLAEKLFGKGGNYVGRRVGVKDGWSVVVGGVYRDFPTNSILRNVCYQTINPGQWQTVLNQGGAEHSVYVKLTEGADTERMAELLLAANPEFGENFEKFIFRPIHEIHYQPVGAVYWQAGRGGERVMPWVLAVVALLVVGIAVVNYVNFSMAMIPYRIKSINIRRIFGEKAWTLRGRMLWQTSVVVWLSVVLALLVVYLIYLSGSLDGFLKCSLNFSRNGFVLWLMLGLTVLIPLLAGVYPAWYATSRRPAMVVNGSFALSPAGRAMRRALIGFQFTVSFVILLMMTLIAEQNHFMRTAPVGYARDSVLYVNIDDVITGTHGRVSHEILAASLRAHPNVESFSWSKFRLGEDPIARYGKMLDGKYLLFNANDVHPDYLTTMGIELVEGRNFRPEDDGTGALIFNETAAREFGLRAGMRFDDGSEVIGIIRDIKNKTFRHGVLPMAFWTRGMWGNNCAVRMVRPEESAALCRDIEERCKESFGAGRMQFYTSADIAGLAYAEESKQLGLLQVFSVISLFIPLIGVFGLVLFETHTKRKEIGVRKVFGATTNGILVMFNLHYLRTLVICFLLAAPVAWYLYGKWIETFAYRTPVGWWLFGVVFLAVAAVVCLTVTVQSWRAAHEKPVDVICK